MLQAKAKVQGDNDSRVETQPTIHPLAANDPTGGAGLAVQTIPNVHLAPPRKGNQPHFPAPRVIAISDKQTRVPVVLGEATYRGIIPVEGIISGQPGANGGALSIRQRGRTFFGNDPELNGEINFIDMLRVNGHIAGSVYSKKGTLIVDTFAVIDADIEVCIAVIAGTVHGDIVAHQKVELGPTAKIYGNIWTRSLEIRSGAIFEGVCQIIEDKDDGNESSKQAGPISDGERPLRSGCGGSAAEAPGI
jgi:cytoskeletal protein CcmA (bactofilin family)